MRPGDTLWDISSRYMDNPNRWPQIQRDNAVPAPKRLQPGQVLSLGSMAALLAAAGDVAVHRKDIVQRPVGAGFALVPGDVIVTGRDGFVTVGFGDGSRVVVPSSSAFRLLVAHGRSTRLELLDGRLESYVEKQKERDFQIRTRTFALGVKGTHFRARSEAGVATLEVLEGEVLATEIGGSKRSIATRSGEAALLTEGAGGGVKALLPAPEQHFVEKRDAVAAAPVQGALSYQLQVARDPGFLQLLAEARADDPQFQLPNDLAPGFYHTRLSAFDAQRVEGMAGAGLVFASNGPSPEESKVQRIDDGTYEIRWTPQPGESHTFELARTADFAAPLVIETGSYPNGVTVGPLDAPARYYWRCRVKTEGEPSLQPFLGGSFEAPPR
ncbi:MAG: FecR domain-containing protein [Variovorax sp.]